MQSYPLAVAVEGEFTSFFKGKDSPLLTKEAAGSDTDAGEGSTETDVDKENKDAAAADTEAKADENLVVGTVLEKSPASARIVLFASNEFLTDEILGTVSFNG